ncbi:hypothetical protein EWM64_g4553 [Hericium alpestre]|uniref:Uncharacterized protein n=1 Tax=Hericium alpestre TaxID=135208 RepID=A0A4Y9ZZE7_9AGAM|nr:hypothetical protein EWM64_g4553 [Hericium alpestre]
MQDAAIFHQCHYLRQLRMQALLALYQFEENDVVPSFLSQGNCFTFILFTRPADWDALTAKYAGLLRLVSDEGGSSTGRLSGSGSVSQGVPVVTAIEERDLPVAQIIYSGQTALSPDLESFSAPFLHAVHTTIKLRSLVLKRSNKVFQLLTDEQLDASTKALLAAAQATIDQIVAEQKVRRDNSTIVTSASSPTVESNADEAVEDSIYPVFDPNFLLARVAIRVAANRHLHLRLRLHQELLHSHRHCRYHIHHHHHVTPHARHTHQGSHVKPIPQTEPRILLLRPRATKPDADARQILLVLLPCHIDDHGQLLAAGEHELCVP